MTAKLVLFAPWAAFSAANILCCSLVFAATQVRLKKLLALWSVFCWTCWRNCFAASRWAGNWVFHWPWHIAWLRLALQWTWSTRGAMLKHFKCLHRCSASSEIPGGSMASEVGYGSWCQTSVDRIRMNLNFWARKNVDIRRCIHINIYIYIYKNHIIYLTVRIPYIIHAFIDYTDDNNHSRDQWYQWCQIQVTNIGDIFYIGNL